MSRKTKDNLLARPEVQGELNKIKIEIKRNISASGPPAPMIRSIDDVTKLKIHRDGEGSAPLFDREDVICNKIDYEEKPKDRQYQVPRLIYQNETNSGSEKNRECSQRRSPKRNDRSYSSKRGRHREESCSCDRDMSGSSQERGETRPQSQREEREHHSSPIRDRSYSPRRRRKRSRSRSSPRTQRSRGRSSSPPLRPGEYRPRRSRPEEGYDRRRGNRRTSRSSEGHSRYPPYFPPNFAPPQFPQYMPVPMFYPILRGHPPYPRPVPFVPPGHRFPIYNNTKYTPASASVPTGPQKVSSEQPVSTANKDNLIKEEKI